MCVFDCVMAPGLPLFPSVRSLSVPLSMIPQLANPLTAGQPFRIIHSPFVAGRPLFPPLTPCVFFSDGGGLGGRSKAIKGLARPIATYSLPSHQLFRSESITNQHLQMHLLHILTLGLLVRRGAAWRDRALGIVEQRNATWNLECISRAPPGRYRYYKKAGEGSYIYVLDSGIDLEHKDFGGRAAFGYDATAEFMGNITAENQTLETGTHVASIAVGAKFGVAKKAKVIDVKVFREPEEDQYRNDGRAIKKGFEWAVDDIVRNDRIKHAVIHLSVHRYERRWTGDDICASLSKLLREALDQGINVVIAAGGWNIEDKYFCLRDFGKAITVGAVDKNNRRWQSPEEDFSVIKWGGFHVDIFAPGVDIEAALAFSGSGSVKHTGTSMAAAHVSGDVATILANEMYRKPSKMWNRVERMSRKYIVQNARGALNRLVYNGVEKSW